MKRLNTLTRLAAVTAVLGAGVASAEAAVLFHEDFESPVGGRVYSESPETPAINDGWGGGDRVGYLIGPDTSGWTGTTGQQAAVIGFRNAVVTSPALANPEAYDNISVMMDVRPGGNSEGSMGNGGEIRFLSADGGVLTRILFYTDGIRVYDFSSKNTGIEWSYDGPATTAHVRMDLDNVNRTFTLTYDQGDGESTYTGVWTYGDYGGTDNPFSYISFKASDGPATAWATNSLAFDNLWITDGSDVPEPTSLALLGLSGLAALRRRR